jgi:hypothetical protein
MPMPTLPTTSVKDALDAGLAHLQTAWDVGNQALFVGNGSTAAVDMTNSLFQPVVTMGPGFLNALIEEQTGVEFELGKNVPSFNTELHFGYVQVEKNGLIRPYGEVNHATWQVVDPRDGEPHTLAGEVKGFIVMGEPGHNVSSANFDTSGSIFTAWHFVAVPQTKAGDHFDFGGPEVVGIFFNYGARKQAQINDGYLAAMRIHNNYAVWNAVRDRMISGNDHCRFFRGQICDPCGPIGPCDAVVCNPCDPCGTFGGRSRSLSGGFIGSGSVANNMWVSYVGRSNTYQSAFRGNDWRISSEGVQVGVDIFKSQRAQFGVMYGYEGSVARNIDGRIESEDNYVGFYGARVLRGGADVRMASGFGWQDYDMVRKGTRVLRNDVNRQHFYASDFKGRTTDFNVELGKRFSSGAWSLRPVMALDYSKNKLRSATEVGTSDLGVYNATLDEYEAVTYHKTRFAQTFLRFGSDLRFQSRNFTLNTGLYYAHDVNDDELSTKVTSVRYGLTPGLKGSDLGRGLVLFNVGGEFQVARNFGVFLGYDGQYRTEGTKTSQNTGYVGGVVRF